MKDITSKYCVGTSTGGMSFFSHFFSPSILLSTDRRPDHAKAIVPASLLFFPPSSGGTHPPLFSAFRGGLTPALRGFVTPGINAPRLASRRASTLPDQSVSRLFPLNCIKKYAEYGKFQVAAGVAPSFATALVWQRLTPGQCGR